MLAVAATCLVAALAAPTAGAAGKHSSKAGASAVSKSAKKSAKKIRKAEARAAVTKKRLARSIRTINRRSRSNRRNIVRLRTNLTAAGVELRKLITDGDAGIDAKINGIVAVVTPILTQLGDGVLQLKAALEGDVAQAFADIEAGFAEVEAGFGEVETALTDIGDFLGGTEYGFGQSIVLENGVTQNAQEGHFVKTPNVPDDVQQAQTEQSFEADVLNPGPVIVAWGMRTNENDDDAPGHCRVTVTDEDGNVDSTDGGDFGIGFLDSPDGSTVTSEDPDNIGFPFGLKIDPGTGDEQDNTSSFVSSVNVADGELYSIAMSCVDTTADPDDPNA